MTRSPRKSGRTSRKTAAAPQDEPPCRTGKGDEAVNEPHKALRSHFDNLREELEKEAAAQPEGAGLDLRLENLRWEAPVIEDVAAGVEEQSLAEKRVADLQQMIKDERRACELMKKTDAERPNQRANLARDWLSASSRLVSELMAVEHLLRGGSLEVPFPGEALNRLQNLLKYMSEGWLPDPIDAALSVVGHPESGSPKRRDIAIAIFYVEAAKSGRIKDHDHNKTVRAAFHVSRSTIQNWVKHRDEFCAGRKPPPDKQLGALLLEAGARYHKNRER